MKDNKKNKQTEKTNERPQGTPISEKARLTLNDYIRVEEGGVAMLRNLNLSAAMALVSEEHGELVDAVVAQDGVAMVDAILDLTGALGIILDTLDNWVLSEAIQEYFHAQASRGRSWKPHMAIIDRLVSNLANGRQRMCMFEGPEYANGVKRGERATQDLYERGVRKAITWASEDLDPSATDKQIKETAATQALQFAGVKLTKKDVNLMPQMVRAIWKSTEGDESPAAAAPEATESATPSDQASEEEIVTAPQVWVVANKVRGSGFHGGVVIEVPAGTHPRDCSALPINGIAKYSEELNALHPLTGFEAVERQFTGQTTTKLAKLKTAINEACKASDMNVRDDPVRVVVLWNKPTKMAENSTAIWNHKGTEALISILPMTNNNMNTED
jgi:NTP pyrophosphatase (non-canonical NTP hydrolase)